METSLRIANPWPNASVFVRERTVSTMDDVYALARTGCPTGTTVIAGFQEKGRGRAPGRRWISPAWESLLATILLLRRDAGFPVSQLPLRAAVATAHAVEEAAGISVGIKWPNDLVFDGRKLAGILCEARGDALLIGVGVNCSQREFPPNMASTACSIFQACGRQVQVFALLAVVLSRMKDTLADLSWREKFLARLTLLNRATRVQPCGSEESVKGTVTGIDEDGSLVLQRADGTLLRIPLGELRAGP